MTLFENLSDRLNDTFKKWTGKGRLSEKNIKEALREVRMSFLEADVNFQVVKQFTDAIKEKALGIEVMKSLSPGQQFIKIVNDELITLLGGEQQDLDLRGKPPLPILLVGLQGSGKTTTAAKLSYKLKELKRNPMLVPADVYRPAAIEQLKTLGKSIGVEVFDSDPKADPVDICRKALAEAAKRGFDTVLFDTAGRLQIDEPLMDELKRIVAATDPVEILFVADGMTGQEAVNVAKGFNDALDITGIVLTKMEGDARGGAALSIKSVTGKPIKFVGVGEKIDALEPFYPDRMAGRILGMGDILSFIEKAQKSIEEEQARRMEEHFKKNMFTLEDFRDALVQMKKMGRIEDLMDMIPGMRQLTKGIKDFSHAEVEMLKIEAIINSMTPLERRNPDIINASRRLRIAKGSGHTVPEINRLLKEYLQMKKVMGRIKKLGVKGLMRGLPGMIGQSKQ